MRLSKKSNQTNDVSVSIKKKKTKKLEDVVIAECVKYLSGLGWSSITLYTGGIPLPGGFRGKNPAKGIPDKIFFNFSKKKLIWIEFKKSHAGIVSNEQKAWHMMLRHCGQIVFLVASLESLIEQLTEMEREDETFERAS